MSTSDPTPITSHEGSKYLCWIRPAVRHNTQQRPIQIDIYSVLVAFNVTCPATSHAIKKLLCAGQRGKGNTRSDLVGAIAAINRAIELLDQSQPNPYSESDSSLDPSTTDNLDYPDDSDTPNTTEDQDTVIPF